MFRLGALTTQTDGNPVCPPVLQSQAQELELSSLGRDDPYGPVKLSAHLLHIKNSSYEFLLSPLDLTHHAELSLDAESFLTPLGLSALNVRSSSSHTTQIGNTISCSLYDRPCQGGKALIRNGLFLIGGDTSFISFLHLPVCPPMMRQCP